MFQQNALYIAMSSASRQCFKYHIKVNIYIRLKTDLFNKSVKTDLLNKSVLVQLLPNSRPSLQD
jgi:hypothetical protein